ncbi:MAG: DUF2027 domain-containing protein [Duncaniella sp.]|nr:DUF2027 domain-containing protein [Duncaniella sp.]
MAKIGDIVRFLNSVGGGVVTRIEGNIAYVDDDGFETPMLLRECVVVGQAPAEEKPKAAPSFRASTTATTVTANRQPEPEPEPDPVEETPEGEKLNVVLAYEPTDIKQLSSTTFNTYLVNDSNYYLYFSYLTRADGSDGWVTRYAGVVEPNIQIWLEEFEAAQLSQMDRVAVQLIAMKKGKEFTLKNPVSVEMKLDTRKFFKLHCFNTGTYFDEPVIALDIVRDDRAVKPATVDAVTIEKGIREKKAVDRRRPVRPLRPKKAAVRRGEIIEVDLHIHELVDNTAGLSPADMLNLQIDEFRRVMDSNLSNKGQKIVFIHGKGE